jgi:hypothetical protein
LLVVHLSEITSLPTTLTTPFYLTYFYSFLYYHIFAIQSKGIKGSLLKVAVVRFSLRRTTSNGGSSYKVDHRVALSIAAAFLDPFSAAVVVVRLTGVMVPLVLRAGVVLLIGGTDRLRAMCALIR